MAKSEPKFWRNAAQCHTEVDYNISYLHGDGQGAGAMKILSWPWNTSFVGTLFCFTGGERNWTF